MWYPATITVAAAAEPVSLTAAKEQCHVEAADTTFDNELNRLIAAARGYAERVCGVRFYTQTVAIKCDSFDDLAWLPEAPVQSITSIEYVDTSGASQTLASSVYEERLDGLDPQVVLKYGQTWPAIQPGSRITVTAVVGHATVPDDVLQAMLLYIEHLFTGVEMTALGGWTDVDNLLFNHRRGLMP